MEAPNETPWEGEDPKLTPAELDAWLDAKFGFATGELHFIWQHKGEELIQRVRDRMMLW
jgi:hypothetical protein